MKTKELFKRGLALAMAGAMALTFTPIAGLEGILTVAEADTTKFVGQQDLVFTGEEQVLLTSGEVAATNEGTVHYTASSTVISNPDKDTVETWETTATNLKGKDAGIYHIYSAEVKDDTVYAFAEQTTVTIAQASPTVTVDDFTAVVDTQGTINSTITPVGSNVPNFSGEVVYTITYSDDSTQTVNATVTDGTVAGANWTPNKTGEVTVIAVFTPTADAFPNYTATAASAGKSGQVMGIALSHEGALTGTAKYGQTLADVTINTGGALVMNGQETVDGEWSFKDDLATSVGDLGDNNFDAVFTPSSNPEKYSALEKSVTVTVNKADAPVIDLGEITATPITYGQALSESTLTAPTSITDVGTVHWTDNAIIPNAGTVAREITFSQTDTTHYEAVADTTTNVAVTVNKANVGNSSALSVTNTDREITSQLH